MCAGLCEACVRGIGDACGGPPYVFATLGMRSGRARLCAGLWEACVRGVSVACGDPPYVFGTLGMRQECSRLCAGLCEACVRGVGGACGDPCDVFGTLGTRSECSRLCAGLCEERVWGIGGACGGPPYVFATLGMRQECSRLCAGLWEACVRGVWCSWWPSLCIRHPRHEAGVPEIVFRTRKASVHPVAQVHADGEETTEVERRNPADSPSRRRENDQTAAKAWQVSRAQPHSYSRTLRGKKSAPHAPHLTVGPFDTELIRPVN